MTRLSLKQLLLRVSPLLLLTSCSSLSSEIFTFDLVPKTDHYAKPENLNILSSTGLRLTSPKGTRVTELSGISWDADEEILYAVNDEGILYHLQLTLKNKAIAGVKVIAEYKLLKKKNKKPLKKKWRDSEGLSSVNHNNGIKGDTELIVSFEGKPRIARYTTTGHFISEVKLPRKLLSKKRYRHKNKALESIIVHPTEGIITAAEFPLKAKPESIQTLYSASGKEWNFLSSKAKGSAVTGLEVLHNGNILVLERAWAGIKNPVVISLSEVKINSCNPPENCDVRKIASLSTTEDWLLDNFEGLAHFKDNQYLVVSDDNDKDFQTTVLVLFEVKPAGKNKISKKGL